MAQTVFDSFCRSQKNQNPLHINRSRTCLQTVFCRVLPLSHTQRIRLPFVDELDASPNHTQPIPRCRACLLVCSETIPPLVVKFFLTHRFFSFCFPISSRLSFRLFFSLPPASAVCQYTSHDQTTEDCVQVLTRNLKIFLRIFVDRVEAKKPRKKNRVNSYNSEFTRALFW